MIRLRPTFFFLIFLASLVPTVHAQFRSAKPVPAPISPAHTLVAEEAKLVDQDSADDRPSFTLDGRYMYFGSRRQSKDPWRVTDPNPQWKWDSDLWYRIRTDSGWSKPINLGPPINNSGGQLNPTVSPRGDMLYFIGGAPVMSAKMVDGKFQAPQPVPGMINGIYFNRSLAQNHLRDSLHRLVMTEMLPDSDLRVRAPDAYDLHYREHMVRHLKTQAAVDFMTTIRCESSITPDGKYAVISENFGKKGEYGLGGIGGEDLWLVAINERGGWDSVLSFNGNINSIFDDTYPFIAADGVTLYFTSNRPCPSCAPGTWGRQDIYRTQFDGRRWTDPVPLGAPFNSDADDYGFSIGPDGETAYFVSNRSGKSRLYQVKLSPQDSAIAPLPVVVLQGRVTDKATHKPVKAEIFVDDLTSAENKFSVYSDSVSGNYVLAGQRGHRFGVQAIAANYLPHSDRFTVPAKGEFDRTKLDIELAPEAVGATAEFKNVQFETGKSTLLRESKLELNRVAEYLHRSAHTNIEIEGHTDDVGSDAANQKLSEARAKSVMNYLVAHGVDRERLTAVGYGKTRPLVKGTSEEARAKNRRVEMTITSKSD